MKNKQKKVIELQEGRMYLISTLQVDSSGISIVSGLYEIDCQLVTDKHYKILVCESKEVYWVKKEWKIEVEEDLTDFYAL